MLVRAWDEDGSGTISSKEFGQALPALGLKVSKEQAEELFNVFDDDVTRDQSSNPQLLPTAAGHSCWPALF